MNIVDYTKLTTNQAAQLVHVHESSIKRWCRDGILPFDLTEGGHRRISLDHLLHFAGERELPCALLDFGEHSPAAWAGLRLAQTQKDFGALIRLGYDWLQNPTASFFQQLLTFCMEHGIQYSVLFDEVIAPIMRQIGEEWQASQVGIGTEHLMTQRVRDAMHFIRYLPTDRTKDDARPKPRAIVGCSAGNYHDIGALSIRMLLEQLGWEALYLGPNVPTEEFAKQQTRHKAALLCISFVPSNVMSDVVRSVDVLARFYDTKIPYQLAIGGQSLPPGDVDQLTQPPLRAVNVFQSTFAFEEWLKDKPFALKTN